MPRLCFARQRRWWRWQQQQLLQRRRRHQSLRRTAFAVPVPVHAVCANGSAVPLRSASAVVGSAAVPPARAAIGPRLTRLCCGGHDTRCSGCGTGNCGSGGDGSERKGSGARAPHLTASRGTPHGTCLRRRRFRQRPFPPHFCSRLCTGGSSSGGAAMQHGDLPRQRYRLRGSSSSGGGGGFSDDESGALSRKSARVGSGDGGNRHRFASAPALFTATSSLAWLRRRALNVVRDRLLQGYEPSPELFAIMLVYFVQGVLGLARLASTFFFKDELHLTPAQVAAFGGIQVFPWTVKPLYGFLSDTLPLFGYRRRSYLAVSGVLGASSWFALSTWASTPAQAVLCSTVASLSVALSDVVADGIVVERVRDAPQEQAGALQSLCWGTSAIGGLVSSYFSGSLLEVVSPRRVFAITAMFPLAVAAASGTISERRVHRIGALTSKGRRAVGGSGGGGERADPLAVDAYDETAPRADAERALPELTAADVDAAHDADEPSLARFTTEARSLARLVWDSVRRPAVFYPVLFVIMWQATPSCDTAFFYYVTNELKFQPEFLGRVRFVSSAAMLGGIVLYNRYLNSVPIKSVLYWTTVASVPLGMTQLVLVTHLNRALGIPDALFALGDSLVLTALGQVAFMPTLVLAARLCPPGAESVLFATLMSLYNGAGITGSEIGALLTQVFGVTETKFDNLALLIAVCNLSSLLPLLAIDFLDRAGLDKRASGDAERAAKDDGDDSGDGGAATHHT